MKVAEDGRDFCQEQATGYFRHTNNSSFGKIFYKNFCFFGVHASDMTKLLSLFNILILGKESETISVNDVADIFKMYGVDYKEVRFKYVLKIIIEYQICFGSPYLFSYMFWRSLTNI